MQAVLNYPKITVVRPQGSLNAANALEFERDLTTALAQKDNAVTLVDLEKLESLDSAGLMALVSGLKVSQSLGKRLSLCSLPASIKIVFELTQLDGAFEIFESETAFVAACLESSSAMMAVVGAGVSG
ncbi:MAG: STAS domain-containing protein [Cyanomargarita calcarea GSE-NOS-MK-12-04C]|jgi:anti-anti-sigma factor|uniref:Anti-sigma factor antagonist n=1 Tax=Cyanomargarita calcarea GSE-NOS-MK-12-04C TaxID=2839659 RepID=A0A951USU4_9CYAN|nr:STAS domain-containing protein [Cyanomargarita calcarea GSE-NOS-MK-12-04C]